MCMKFMRFVAWSIKKLPVYFSFGIGGSEANYHISSFYLKLLPLFTKNIFQFVYLDGKHCGSHLRHYSYQVYQMVFLDMNENVQVNSIQCTIYDKPEFFCM